jgi:hypothetical protein
MHYLLKIGREYQLYRRRAPSIRSLGEYTYELALKAGRASVGTVIIKPDYPECRYWLQVGDILSLKDCNDLKFSLRVKDLFVVSDLYIAQLTKEIMATLKPVDKSFTPNGVDIPVKYLINADFKGDPV